MAFAVHHDLQWFGEAHMTHMLGLLDSWHAVQDLLLEKAVTGIGIDREVTNAKGGEILDSMPAVEETEHVRHVRFSKPLKIMMDGKRQQGVVLLPE